jgi:F-type H+-transporting ATPase subunit alpha
VSIFAGVRGFLDKIKVEDVNRFEARLLDEIRTKGANILDAIRTEKALSKDTEEKLKGFLDNFSKVFV